MDRRGGLPSPRPVAPGRRLISPSVSTDVAFTNDVRLKVLELTTRTAKVPDAVEVGEALQRPKDDVTEAFIQLGDSHVYVLEPGDPTRLRMANPFSAVPTSLDVAVGPRSYFGNCAWDALGIVSLLGGDGRVTTRCPDCQEALVLEVAGGRLLRGEGIVHFGVPARHWWDDIIHT